MKRLLQAILTGLCILWLASCNLAPSSSGTSSPSATSTSPSATTRSSPLIRTLTPPQGGPMLYPTIYPFPEEIWAHMPAYILQLMGLINQDGQVIAPPQYTDVRYYKDAAGTIQYILAGGRGTYVIYKPDGTVHMELKAEQVAAFNGCPYLLVGLKTFYGGPGSEPDNLYTLYHLHTKEQLVGEYNVIRFLDAHTVLLQHFIGKDYQVERVDSYLCDLNSGDRKPVKLDGYPLETGNHPLFQKTVTRIPAIQAYVSFEKLPDKPHGYLGRDGHWVAKSEEEQGVKPEEDNTDPNAHYIKGLDENLSFEGLYYWVVKDGYQGYQDKNGNWVYRELVQRRFLED